MTQAGPEQIAQQKPSPLIAQTPTRRTAPNIKNMPDVVPPYKVDGESAVVEVTGRGASRTEARLDAIRLALQRTMQQLVVVDRLIKNDQIITDKIMSTLNGYVEDFKEIEVQRLGEQYQ